jgi:hypothetical protein
MPADALRVRGRHNALNALAALALATAIGCPLAPMLHGCASTAASRTGSSSSADRRRRGLRRQQGHQRRRDRRALIGLGAERGPAQLVVILGGDGKGQDFTQLLEPLRRMRAAIATRPRRRRIEPRVAPSAGLPSNAAASLEAAVGAGLARAERATAVLLSPACASLDMFRNYGTGRGLRRGRRSPTPPEGCLSGARGMSAVSGGSAIGADDGAPSLPRRASPRARGRGRRRRCRARSRSATGSASTPGEPAGCSASIGPWSGSSSPMLGSAW